MAVLIPSKPPRGQSRTSSRGIELETPTALTVVQRFPAHPRNQQFVSCLPDYKKNSLFKYFPCMLGSWRAVDNWPSSEALADCSHGAYTFPTEAQSVLECATLKRCLPTEHRRCGGRQQVPRNGYGYVLDGEELPHLISRFEDVLS